MTKMQKQGQEGLRWRGSRAESFPYSLLTPLKLPAATELSHELYKIQECIIIFSQPLLKERSYFGTVIILIWLFFSSIRA